MGAPAVLRCCRLERHRSVPKVDGTWLLYLSYVPGHLQQLGQLAVHMFNLVTWECWPGLNEQRASSLLEFDQGLLQEVI